MALTAEERAQVRMYLGYQDPSVFPRVWGYAVNSSLETNMDRIGPDTELLVRKTLLQLKAIDDGVYGDGTSGNAGAIAQQGIKQLGQGEIEWFPGGSATARLAFVAGLVRRLAALLGVRNLTEDGNGSASPIPLA